MKIQLSTYVPAPPTAVFDMSLDIGTHLDSMSEAGETAVAGVTSGIIGLGESVTWRARHFRINWTMTSTITAWDRPRSFVDEQAKGPFRRFRHLHTFEAEGDGTRMVDDIDYTAPFSFIGYGVDRLILNRYMQRLIKVRNEFIVDAFTHARSEDEIRTVHAYRFEPRVARWNRLFNVRAATSQVTVSQQRLVATFGPWTVNTTVDNVADATITGPYRAWRVAGPARLSLADRGLTFASSTERGLCLHFARPVRGLDPLGLLRHPTLTVTVDDPAALAAELGIDGEVAHADLAHGTLRGTAKTILRSLRTHRSVKVAAPRHDAAAPPTDLPDDAQAGEAGIGPWFHRRYRIRILDPELSAEALISAIQSDPNIICDTTLAPFVKDSGSPGQMSIGDRYTVRTAGPWDGPVEVVALGPSHIRLATLEGHMEAGIIDIHAHDEGPAIDFEIESWARSGDLAFHILYDVVGVAKTVQTAMWTTACERAAEHVRGRPQGAVQISETRSPYSGNHDVS